MSYLLYYTDTCIEQVQLIGRLYKTLSLFLYTDQLKTSQVLIDRQNK